MSEARELYRDVYLRVTLERRLPSILTVVSQTVTVGANAPYATSAVVSPGFYVATVEPLDFLSGADGIFAMSMLSNYVNRPGGGFQGGVVVGGYHDPVVSATSGFAGFCLADAHTVQMRTEGRPTRGAAGAGDMRVVVTDAVGTVMYANPVNPPSSDDHGNSCATATSVSINSTLSGFLSPTSDVDFFRFTLSANTTITAVANSVFDSKGTLYDGNCNVITEDDDSAGNLDFRLQRTLTAGTYYLRVASFQGGSGGNYTVALSGVASGDDHGNSCATATAVSMNTSFTGTISPSSDVDYFRFTLGSTTLVTAQAATGWSKQRPGTPAPLVVCYGLGREVASVYYRDVQPVENAAELSAASRSSRDQGRDLLVLQGYSHFNRAKLADGMAMLDDRAQFDELGVWPGIEPDFLFRLLKAR